jgi:ABC-type multidrug transport system ATPase subunit
VLHSTDRAPAIEVDGLVKRFGAFEALKGVSFQVPTGGVLGLLGPNGAGKTTAVRVLTTLLPPDGGTAHVLGCDVTEHPMRVRASIGLAGQYAAVDENLTAAENLRLVGRLTHLGDAELKDRTGTLLERFDLLHAGDRLADNIVVIDHGSVIAEGTASELKADLGETVIEMGFGDAASVQQAEELAAPVGSVTGEGNVIRVSVTDGPTAMLELVRRLDGAHLAPTTMMLREPTLDDVFLSLTGHAAEEPAGNGDAAPEKKPRRGRRRP